MHALKCLGVLLLLASVHTQAQKSSYKYNIDLTRSGDDKFHVELTTPPVKTNTVEFHLPKTVPGTYSNDDYGYFVNGLKAFDKNGKELTVTRSNVNTWVIGNANTLAKITYEVDDTFDDQTRKEKVFEPTGSGLQHDTAYVINTYTVTGYFKGMEEMPYTLSIQHKPDFYGATAMKDADRSNTVDVFSASTYNELADNPIMYTRPDTATIRVGGAEILISVYSPNKKISSAFLASKLDSLTRAQVQYLGGKLPVTKYAYLVYLFDKAPVSSAAGALEHSYSSLYSLNESDPEVFAQGFKDVAAHEFFHILTPLNVHAEEIQYFDFTDPKMSAHLWLYEGSTEYHAHKAQVEAGLTTVTRFLNVIGGKITSSRAQYNDTLPFTYMSKHVLEPAYEKQYGNVYQKGALINMALDIKLRELSGGKRGLMDLVRDLSAKYGKGKPFKDEELFSVIGQLTSPQIKTFLETHVGGNTPLPFDELFSSVGIQWTKDTSVQVFSFGNFRPRAATSSVYVGAINTMDDFGKLMDYKVGDTIVAINGTAVDRTNYAAVTGRVAAQAKEGETLQVDVLRTVDGKQEKLSLKQPIRFVPQRRFNILRLDPAATPAQVKLREQWMNITGMK